MRFSLAVAAALTFLLHGEVRAQYAQQSARLGTLGIDARQRWPTTCAWGWMPIFVELSNDGADRRQVTIAAGARGEGAAVQHIVELEANERRVVELSVPLFSFREGWGNTPGYSLEVLSAGERTTLYNFGADDGQFADVKPVMVFAEELPAAGREDAWREALSRRAPSRSRATPGQSFGGGVHMVHSSVTGTPNSDVPVAAARFSEMPARPESYSSLAAVVLVRPQAAEDALALDALFTWTRLGGLLVISGRGAHEFAAAHAQLAPWLEPRFRQEAADGIELYRCGIGGLILAEDAGAAASAPLDDQRLSEELAAVLADWRTFPSPHDQRASKSLNLPGFGRPPYLAFASILLLFVILVGPVNFIYIKRWKRPVLLLLTIPAISFVFTAGLFAYGILAQGIDTRAAVAESVLLDQRADRVDIVTDRQLYVGWARKRGLEPGPLSIVLPAEGTPSAGRWTVRDAGRRFLSGAFMPVREPTRHVVLSERSSRLGIDFSRSGGVLRATSRFEVTLEEFVVRAADGLWSSNEPLVPGATIDLSPCSEPACILILQNARDALRATIGADQELLPGTYLARAQRAAFSDGLGLDARTRLADCGIIGIVDEGELR